jgi:hypothetical protein
MRELPSLKTCAEVDDNLRDRAGRCPRDRLRLLSPNGPSEDLWRLIPAILRRCLDGKDVEMVSPDTARFAPHRARGGIDVDERGGDGVKREPGPRAEVNWGPSWFQYDGTANP